ncbi:FTR1 family protein [Campylobacter sp. LH-2024]|uniref:FTR1 family iron permease n=1 Tax=Campylobacter TaxID=194 RepID=UPI001D27974F|nr:FTR1 family iron permease [Campylobacter sp. RM10543]MBZ7947692.1 FTR1 family iron permease [Campylobacter sp. RM9929]MBZ7950861.1 FTR1 family iron permease [Campylobacter sp. W0046]MBZ7967444.1 FTR1 family iron permease [Campylobacter sp. RM9756]MBZ7973012.1 FTR1 family iron permease [Campylobacter sp. RM9753]
MKIFRIILFYFLFFFATTVFAKVDNYIAEANIIKSILKQSLELYKKGDAQQAKKLSEDAYFQHFENMEGPIGRNIGRKAITMERKFINLRRMYKEKSSLEQINALIESLYYDLDEVAPILQNGYKLKAEASQTNYDKAAAEKSSLEANAKREADAEALIAQITGVKPLSNNTDTNTSAHLSNLNSKDIDQDLQAAASMDARLQFILDNISTKFTLAANAFKNGNYNESKNLLNDALFNDYRNTKVEILINKFTKAGNDQKFQQALRTLMRKINEQKLDERKLRDDLDNIEQQLFDIFLQIPNSELSKLKLKGFNNENQGKDYSKVGDDIKVALNEILNNYNGFNISAINELQNTYLDIFEASGMENKIGAVDSNLKLKIESLFSQSVALIKNSADKKELKATFDELEKFIKKGIDKIQDSTPYSLFIWALGIIIREGLEALIIVVAIVSYLVQSGNKNRLNIAYSALFTGIILSFITAFAVSWIFKENAGQSRELIEGITMLIAVLLLFYVGFWLLSNAQNKKWASFIKQGAIDAISNNSAKTLWITVFLAVYREGAETVLFYQALLFDAKTSTDLSAIFGGLGLGILILIVLYFLLKAGAIRIPVKQFFYITSYIIFYMVFVFTGKGIAELIEGKIILPSLIPINFEPILWLGIYPYYETLIPQFIVLILLIIGILMTKQISKKGVK